MLGKKLVETNDKLGDLHKRPISLNAPRTVGASLRDYYLFSILLGLRSLVGPVRRDALARIVNPLSYPRLIEFSLVMQRLSPRLDGTATILDIGSPKLPLLVLAHRTRATLYGTDIRPYFLKSTRHFLERLGHRHELGRRLFLEVQDARQLTYPDATFDQIYTISVLEHIPDSGDSEAMQEIRRVLKPAGIVALTVPFSAAGYHEDWVAHDVYEREQHEREHVFYQRYYDDAALQDRLITPSGMEVVAIDYFGEPGFKFEPYWNRIPMRWKIPFLWMQPFIAQRLMKLLPPSAKQHAVGACVTLRNQEHA